MQIKKLGQSTNSSPIKKEQELAIKPTSNSNVTNSIGQQQTAVNNLAGIDINFAKKIRTKEELSQIAQENAPEILSKANFIIRDSKTILDEIKEKYSESSSVIKFANESFFGRIFDIDDNKSIIFTSTQFDNDNPDTMEEFDLDGNLKRTTYFNKDLKPTIIKEYDNKNDKYDEYQFSPIDGEITVMKGVKQINRTNFSIDKQYSYKDNALHKYEEGILYSSIAKFTATTIEYNKEEKSITFATNKKYSNELENSYQEEYVFVDNKLKKYSENYCVSRNARKNNPGNFVIF